MTKYIERRRKGLYAVLEIPKAVQVALNRRRFRKSLETRDMATAVRRVHRVVDEWQQQIAKARGATVDPMEADLRFWKRALSNPERHASVLGTGDDNWTPREVLLDGLQERAEKLEAKSPGAGVQFYQRATSNLTGTLDHLEDWLASDGGTERGKAAKRTDIKRLAEQFPNTVDVTKKAVRRWCDTMLQDEGLQRTTVIRLLSGCRVYWAHLSLHEIVPDGDKPFDGLNLPKRAVGGDNGTKRVWFSAEEVVRLHKAAQEAGHQPLVDMITLGMYTGARAGEITALRVEDVDLDGKSFNITGSKTEAGIRTVPIHPALQDTLVRLCRDSADGYVMTGLSVDKWGDRSGGIRKRFGNLKTRLGFPKGKTYHSIRKTVITMLQHADVRTTTIQDIVGHERKGMTEGTYYDGATPEAKAEAIAKLVYPTT